MPQLEVNVSEDFAAILESHIESIVERQSQSYNNWLEDLPTLSNQRSSDGAH